MTRIVFSGHLALPFQLMLMLAIMIMLMIPGPCHAGDEQSFALTTDTPAYCAQLVKQLEARRSTLADVQRLLSEGRDMCDRGEIRGGIRRLRRALVMLHHKALREDPPPS